MKLLNRLYPQEHISISKSQPNRLTGSGTLTQPGPSALFCSTLRRHAHLQKKKGWFGCLHCASGSVVTNMGASAPPGSPQPGHRDKISSALPKKLSTHITDCFCTSAQELHFSPVRLDPDSLSPADTVKTLSFPPASFSLPRFPQPMLSCYAKQSLLPHVAPSHAFFKNECVLLTGTTPPNTTQTQMCPNFQIN